MHVLGRIVCTFLLMSTTSSFNTVLEQEFAMEPQDQVAVVGARVILPCRVLNKQGVLQWTKDDFGLGTRRKLVGFERYSMIGSDEEGDYSLQIYPVSLDDDALFQCQVSPGTFGEFYLNNVSVRPFSPMILWNRPTRDSIKLCKTNRTGVARSATDNSRGFHSDDWRPWNWIGMHIGKWKTSSGGNKYQCHLKCQKKSGKTE